MISFWCLALNVCSPVKYERIKFLVLALKNSVEVYAWAPKPYHKFMAFKVSRLLADGGVALILAPEFKPDLRVVIYVFLPQNHWKLFA